VALPFVQTAALVLRVSRYAFILLCHKINLFSFLDFVTA
jgi:hypothetical protein